MAYLAPSEFVTKMVDAGESKVFMSTRDTLIRAYMAGAILALAAWFAVTITVNTGQPLVGALLFPVGFCILYLLGFDLLTGVFVLVPLALIDKRPGVTLGGVLRNWGLVFVGNFGGALRVVDQGGDVGGRSERRIALQVDDEVGFGQRLCRPHTGRVAQALEPGDEGFGHLQADVAGADDHRRLGVAFLQEAVECEGVAHGVDDVQSVLRG